jgi:hypothetical protein
MIGQERAVLPLIADQEFGIASRTVVLSFILCFGIVKAPLLTRVRWVVSDDEKGNEAAP